MQSHLFFQYCPKLVVLSADRKSVLLARRRGEADYNGVYSFIGGKMETTDASIIEGVQREKNEEIGPSAKIKILPHESYNLMFRKKDGSSMIIPHIAAVFVCGDIMLSDEYSDYQWVELVGLPNFGPKIENIFELTKWAADKLKVIQSEQLFEI